MGLIDPGPFQTPFYASINLPISQWERLIFLFICFVFVFLLKYQKDTGNKSPGSAL
jgi:hypothetical protein